MSDTPTDGPPVADPARILLVEDDADIVTLLVEVLGMDGFDVTVARDGLEGLLRLQSDPPDLALVDIMMPDVNGVRMLEQLIEEGDGDLGVAVIVITGSPEGAYRAGELLGRDNVFEKPFELDALITRIRARLQEG